ncbi:MAG: NAD-dependent epimerase/dehydratase family protein [Anaerolineaceae bacterium]|nr:NAD-dependent epimerase/dehydratase family protein [Anaerolineaceae bacterium]
MQHIFVTGAAGFIASRICGMLLDEGYEVTGIDILNDIYDVRLKEYRLNQLIGREGFHFFRTDITDFNGLEQLFSANRYDAVINIAGIPGVRLSMKDPWLYLNVNIGGTLNLLECCRRHDVKKFIQASTSSIYGENAPFPTDENASSDRPLQPYSASKKGAEAECHAYHYLYDIDVTIFRFFTVYGPAGRPDMAIYRFIKWIEEGETILLNGDGNQTRGFTYVDDIARGCILGLKPVGYEIMNLGGHESISINDLIRKIETLTGKQAVIQHLPVVRADMLANLADVSKAQKLLDWQPEIGLDEGLRRTIDWYEQGRDWLKDIRI